MRTMTERRDHGCNDELLSTDLAVIARNASGLIITHIACTRSRDIVSAMRTARSVLRLKPGAVRVEVHHNEGPASDYVLFPLATISQDDQLSTSEHAS